MDEEKELRKKSGTKNPFKVPDGYFENLTQNIMEKLPDNSVEEESITLWNRVKPWLYMAAMFCGLIFGAKLLINKPLNEEIGTETAFNIEQDILPNMLIDPVSNQTMMDDYSLYKYLNDFEEEINESQHL